MSHLSPVIFGLHSSHLLPVNPSLHVQSPLTLSHSKVVDPSGLQLQSEILKDWINFQKNRKQLFRQTLAGWIIIEGFVTYFTLVPSDIRFAFITFASSESLLAHAISIDTITFHCGWTIRVTVALCIKQSDGYWLGICETLFQLSPT